MRRRLPRRVKANGAATDAPGEINNRGDAAPHRSLAARGITVEFAGLRALDGVDLTLHRGEILGLIGPNGAGKTTLVNVLSGFQRPRKGAVELDGNVITDWAPRRRARSGLARTFQGVRLFAELTVLQNVEVVAIHAASSRQDAREAAAILVEQVGLSHRATDAASDLPHGEQRLLGIARALALRPSFLLLDEPAAGLNDVESSRLVAYLRELPATLGAGVMVIEHDMGVIMQLCDSIQVLDYGRTIAGGTPEYIRSHPDVLTAYLGTMDVAGS